MSYNETIDNYLYDEENEYTQANDLWENFFMEKQDEIDKRHNLFFIDPLQYIEFVYLMAKSTIVLTDSGGIQEEAPGLGKPVLVMRDTTERPEALASGTVHLVGTNYDKIINEVRTLLDDKIAYEKMSKAINPYGDGNALTDVYRCLGRNSSGSEGRIDLYGNRLRGIVDVEALAHLVVLVHMGLQATGLHLVGNIERALHLQ